MKFNEILISGEFIKRYKRFFVDVRIGKEIVVAHCPNTGSMHGLLKKGNKVWISKSNNPNRKLKYTLEIIESNKTKIGVNTQSTNKIVLHAFKNNLINEFSSNLEIKPESKFGLNTRFDFMVNDKKNKAYVEVKNVTLSRKKGLAEFPDSITARGTKHLKHLAESLQEGWQASMLYVVQRSDVNRFTVAEDIDTVYAKELVRVSKLGVQVHAWTCSISLEEIRLDAPLPIVLG